MSQRKLQQEIDKLLKKVKEGLQDFEDVYEKFQNTDASNTSYREKLESDLKREIKKLQKHREQIKTWLSKEDVKDKQVILMENRRLIESGMERFKTVEKLMKTKQFSTEALTNPDIIKDPRELKKRDIFLFVQECLEELQKQLESYEAQENEEQIERHAFHIANLENMLKMLQNNELEPDSIEEYQDDIKYYVENNDDPDFIEYDTIYEDIGCEIKPGDKDEVKESGTPSKLIRSSKADRSPKKKLSPAPVMLLDKSNSSSSLASPSVPPTTLATKEDSNESSPQPQSRPPSQPQSDTQPQQQQQPETIALSQSIASPQTQSLPQSQPQTEIEVHSPRDLSKEIDEILAHDQVENDAFRNPLFQPELTYWLQTKRPLLQPYDDMPPAMVSQLESSLLNCPDSLDADTPHLFQIPYHYHTLHLFFSK